MSTIYGRPSPGGSGQLRWNIYTGLTEPPVADEGLWVQVDRAMESLTILLDSVRPHNPAEGTLFIRHAMDSDLPEILPVLSCDGIRYRVAAGQLFSGGQWQNLSLYRAEGGQWVRFSSGEYYLYTGLGSKARKTDLSGNLIWEADTGNTTVAVIPDAIARVVYVISAGVHSSAAPLYFSKVDMDTGQFIMSAVQLIAGIFGSSSTKLNVLCSTPALDRTRQYIVGTGGLRHNNGTTTSTSYYVVNTADLTLSCSWALGYTYCSQSGVITPDNRYFHEAYSSYGACSLFSAESPFKTISPYNSSANIRNNHFAVLGNKLLSVSWMGDFRVNSLDDKSFTTYTMPVNRTCAITVDAGGNVIISNDSVVNYYQLENDGSLTLIKSLMLSGEGLITKLVITPDDVVVAAHSSGKVYRLNSADEFVHIGSANVLGASSDYPGGCIAVDPMDRNTFPEYF